MQRISPIPSSVPTAPSQHVRLAIRGRGGHVVSWLVSIAGINGFGRIGRSFSGRCSPAVTDAGVELVAVNDPMGDARPMAFLLKHDSVGGTLQRGQGDDNGFSVDGKEVSKLEVRDPAEIPGATTGSTS